MRIEKARLTAFAVATLMVFGCRDGAQLGDEVTTAASSSDSVSTSEFIAQLEPTGTYPTARNGDVLLGNPDYPAMSYGAWRTDSRSTALVPTIAEIKEDLRIMEAMGIKLIRNYGTDEFGATANLLTAIDELTLADATDNDDSTNFEMYVMQGVWIGNADGDASLEAEGNATEMATVVNLANQYQDYIKVIAVGNEAMVHWAGYHVTPGIILAHVQDLQAKKANGDIPANIWITSSDNHASWAGEGDYANPDLDALIEAVDYVSVHTYPFHDTKWNSDFWLVPEVEQSLTTQEQADLAMERAKDYAVEQVINVQNKVLSVSPGKQIHVGETGWASYTTVEYGDGQTGAADEYKQKAYYDSMREWTDANNVSLFFFEMFDEPWKGDAWNSETNFGLIDINGNAKYALWDLVEAGTFDGLTRGGLDIVKSNGGIEQTVIESILTPSYETVAVDTVVEGDAYIAYSGEDDSFSMKYWGDVWGSGTSYSEVSGEAYSKAFELTPGPGWGASHAVIAWGNDADSAIDISGFSSARFKVKPSGSHSTVTVSVQNGVEADKSEITYQLSEGTDLGNGWVEIEAALPDFNMTWIGLIFEGTGTVGLADVYFVAE